MATVTLRPDATVSNGGSTVTGAATRHAALADDSDSSYVELTVNDNPRFGFNEPTIPADAALKSIALRMRCRRVSGGLVRVECVLDAPEQVGSELVQVTWMSPTTITPATATLAPFGDSPSDIEVQLTFLPPSNDGLRVYELYVDVVYVPKPVCNVLTPTGTVTEDNQPTVTWEMT